MSEIQKMIVALNSIKVGDLNLIFEKLGGMREDLQATGLDDQARILEQAQEALRGGRVPEFRKLLARATAELGHRKNHRGAKDE
jgi:hypothetical protein